MFCYDIYGFTIASDVALSGLRETPFPQEAPSSRKVHVRWVATSESSSNGDAVVVTGSPQEMQVSVPRIGMFAIRDGDRVLVKAVHGADPDYVCAYLLGVVLGVLLHQRGMLVLHASCIMLDGAACLFAGAMGAGKSTFAASLLPVGARLLADDIAAVEWRDGIPWAQAGYPMMRLHPDVAVRTIGVDRPFCPQPLAKLEKKGYLLDDFFEPKPYPIKAIYLLDFADLPDIIPIGGHQALVDCLPYLYFQHRQFAGQAVLMERLTRLLHHVSVFRFRRRPGLHFLEQEALRLKNHATSLQAESKP
ncbi:MAG: hypothetical protein M1457_11815 [bacterium]|nr:hypothetical protein [bacterium]